jgi:hypothetical protein
MREPSAAKAAIAAPSPRRSAPPYLCAGRVGELVDRVGEEQHALSWIARLLDRGGRRHGSDLVVAAVVLRM